MVTGVLNDSTNQTTKKPKQQRAPSEPAKDRPSTSKILFAPQPQTFPSTNLFPMPKALTASLPVFDGKSEKIELFKDLFRNNIKMYPHLTETQRTVIWCRMTVKNFVRIVFTVFEKTEKKSKNDCFLAIFGLIVAKFLTCTLSNLPKI